MSTAARRRLMRDFKVGAGSDITTPIAAWPSPSEVGLEANRALQRMQTDPPAGVSASPVPDNVMTWYVTVVKGHDS